MSDYYQRNYRQYLPANLDARVLDIGCGQGNFVRYLNRLGYRDITAVDIDENAIASLKGLKGVKAKRLALGSELPTELRGPWDLIVAKQMIYYLDRREAASLVRSISQSLSKDGLLAIEVFNGSLLSSRFTELKDPAILTAYTELGLKRLLEWNGLTVDRLFGADSGGGVIYRMVRSIWFRIYRMLLILERGRDDELPNIDAKSVIAIARRS